MAQAAQPPAGGMPLQFAPGQQPTPQQIQQIQAQFFAEAAKWGLTPQQFRELLIRESRLQQEAAANQQQQQQGGQQGGGQQQQQQQQQGGGGQAQPGPGQIPVQQQSQVPIQPGPPKPEAIALAKFLKTQDLKSRECILMGNGGSQRKELFKVKRAIRALHSPAYEKAQKKKNSLLPPIADRPAAERAFLQLPMSYLALRVAQHDPSANPGHGEPGHVHGGGGGGGKAKGKNGKKAPWTVAIVPQQMAQDDLHFVWLYEETQWRQKAYAGLALVAIITVVMFPLWPYTLRVGVWYLSMAALGLLGAFFAMAIVRFILFVASSFTHPPGLWLYPNLFEDVGFFDSFKPLWAWQETPADIAAKKTAKKEKKLAKKNRALGIASPSAAGKQQTESTTAATAPTTTSTTKPAAAPVEPTPVPRTNGSTGVADTGILERRKLAPRVEEVEDDED